MLLRVCLLEILACTFLTPSSVDSAYKHTSGICCFYLQSAGEWCVLWSVYVGIPIDSERHIICRP